jgi:hypothetical protein
MTAPGINYTQAFRESGKVAHNYHEIYNVYLQKYRNQPISLLEIGLSINRHSPGTSSLHIWEEYFPEGKIVGVDIDPYCEIYKTNKNHIHIGSQNDSEFLSKVAEQHGGFDVIIDDGSHINQYTINAFNTLWPHLKSGGSYIIEDLHCSYENITENAKGWPGMQYNPQSDIVNRRSDIDAFLTGQIHKLDRKEEIAFITMYPTICVIRKNA